MKQKELILKKEKILSQMKAKIDHDGILNIMISDLKHERKVIHQSIRELSDELQSIAEEIEGILIESGAYKQIEDEQNTTRS